MKKYILLFVVFILLISSCKKECPNAKEQPDSKYKGKVKSLKAYSYSNDTTQYYFYYDSISGNLQSASRKYYGSDLLNSDTVTTVFYFEKHNDTSIYIHNSSTSYIKKIMVHNRQIVATYLFDTITNAEYPATTISIMDNKVDSIIDIGQGSAVYDISYGNFMYDANNNCTNYTSYWTDILSGFPVNYAYNYAFTFTTKPNTNMLHWQIPGDVLGNFDQASQFNEVIYFLGINGYYIVQPNKYLIDSALYSATDAYAKYSYSFTNGNITNVVIKTGANSVPFTENYYQEYTYY